MNEILSRMNLAFSKTLETGSYDQGSASSLVPFRNDTKLEVSSYSTKYLFVLDWRVPCCSVKALAVIWSITDGLDIPVEMAHSHNRVRPRWRTD